MTRGHGWSLAFTMWRTFTSYFLAGFYRRFLRVHHLFFLTNSPLISSAIDESRWPA
jgi:hypothetical protein